MTELQKKYLSEIDKDIQERKEKIKDLQAEIEALVKIKEVIMHKGMNFSELLIKISTDHNMTLKEEAERLGFSTPALTRWRGGGMPDARHHSRIANSIHEIAPEYSAQFVFDLLQ